MCASFIPTLSVSIGCFTAPICIWNGFQVHFNHQELAILNAITPEVVIGKNQSSISIFMISKVEGHMYMGFKPAGLPFNSWSSMIYIVINCVLFFTLVQMLRYTKLFLGIVGLASIQLFQKSTVLLVHWRATPL